MYGTAEVALLLQRPEYRNKQKYNCYQQDSKRCAYFNEVAETVFAGAVHKYTGWLERRNQRH